MPRPGLQARCPWALPGRDGRPLPPAPLLLAFSSVRTAVFEIFETRATVTHSHLTRPATPRLVCFQYAPTLILENELPIVHIYVDKF